MAYQINKSLFPIVAGIEVGDGLCRLCQTNMSGIINKYTKKGKLFPFWNYSLAFIFMVVEKLRQVHDNEQFLFGILIRFF